MGDVEEHRKLGHRAQQKLKELTESLATSDVDALESLAEKAKELDASLAEAGTSLKTLLGETTLDELLREQSVLEATHSTFLQAHPEWDATPLMGSLGGAGRGCETGLCVSCGER